MTNWHPLHSLCINVWIHEVFDDFLLVLMHLVYFFTQRTTFAARECLMRPPAFQGHYFIGNSGEYFPYCYRYDSLSSVKHNSFSTQKIQKQANSIHILATSGKYLFFFIKSREYESSINPALFQKPLHQQPRGYLPLCVADHCKADWCHLHAKIRDLWWAHERPTFESHSYCFQWFSISSDVV